MTEHSAPKTDHEPDHDHDLCAAELMARAERACARHNARLTSLRRDVLEAVGESHRAAGAYEIIERLARGGARPAPISIYRALEFLGELGLVHRIESRNAFIACNRLHEAGRAVLMVCEHCGTVDELEAASVFDGLEVLSAARGFETSRAVIELSGRCAPCQESGQESGQDSGQEAGR
jgi:Fur family transcriptional regulator, zinc uptake regulator